LNDKLAILDAILEPIETHVMALERFCLTVPLRIPRATLLSVVTTVAGWGHPIAWRAAQRGAAAWALRKAELGLALAAKRGCCA